MGYINRANFVLCRAWPLLHISLLVINRLKKKKNPFRIVSSQNRKENPQKLTQLSSRSHPRHLVGKRTAQKDTTIDITSDSQVNSNFPNRWSPASLTFNNYFYLFLYLYITWITINNNAPHPKSPKNPNRRAALGRPAIKITGGLQLSWFNWWVSFAPEFQCCYFCESSCLFYLRFNFDFCVSKIMHLWARNLPRKPNN